jgi:hypothetical protein
MVQLCHSILVLHFELCTTNVLVFFCKAGLLRTLPTYEQEPIIIKWVFVESMKTCKCNRNFWAVPTYVMFLLT